MDYLQKTKTSVMTSLLYKTYRWMWASLDWLFPPYCGGCGKRGERWCVACMQKVALILPPLCKRCGKKMAGGYQALYCRDCYNHRPSYYALRSWASFEGVTRNALHRLKYNRDIALGEVLCRPLTQLMQEVHWQVDLVVPVPIGRQRGQERGYNQAALLAKPLALSLGLRYAPHGLTRVRETISQVGLSRQDRQQNVKGAFAAQQRIVEGKSVLVVDDVTTTGATLDACSQAILDGGAHTVFCLTLARAVHP